MRRSRTHTSNTKQQPLTQLLNQLSRHRPFRHWRALHATAVIALGSITLMRSIEPGLAATPEPTAATLELTLVAQATTAPDYPTLSAGSTGDRVSRLQATLKLLGFYRGDINGNYTPATQDAVSRFQSASGLTADGMTGPATWRKLLPVPDEVEAAIAANIATNIATSSPPMIAPPPASSAVPIPSPSPAATRPATAQTTQPTATQPTATQPTATQPAATQPAAARPPERSAPIEGPPTLRPSARGSAVAQLQRELQELDYYRGSIDGGYGEQTQAAVRAFQRDYKLMVDAVVGPSTWDALASARAATTAEPEVSGTEPPVLRPDDEGPAVAQLQRELQELDYYRGNIDGGYGEQTQAAVRAFQRDQQLATDAIVGPSTWDALTRALARSEAARSRRR